MVATALFSYLFFLEELEFEDIFLDLSRLCEAVVCGGESGNAVVIILHCWVHIVGLCHGIGSGTGAS